MRLGLRLLLLLLLVTVIGPAATQPVPARRTPGQFGFRHLMVLFGRDTVDVLVQSNKGEELRKKPLLLLRVQGSLPMPLILVDKGKPYRVFPFVSRAGADSLAARCHLVSSGSRGCRWWPT